MPLDALLCLYSFSSSVRRGEVDDDKVDEQAREQDGGVEQRQSRLPRVAVLHLAASHLLAGLTQLRGNVSATSSGGASDESEGWGGGPDEDASFAHVMNDGGGDGGGDDDGDGGDGGDGDDDDVDDDGDILEIEWIDLCRLCTNA